MKRNIVQFKNGKYAVREKSFFWKPVYVDLSNFKYRWSKNDEYFDDCVGTLEQVTNCFGYFSEKVIK